MFVMLKQVDPGQDLQLRTSVQDGMWDMYFWIDAADALFAELKANGATIDYAPCDNPTAAANSASKTSTAITSASANNSPPKHLNYPLSPRERAGVRVVTARPHAPPQTSPVERNVSLHLRTVPH